MKKIVSLAVMLVFVVTRAFSFSAEGHKTVACIADSLLSAQTKKAVAEILDGETLMQASVWPDEIKPPFGALAGTPAAHAFNHDHPDNKKWHYVNYPVGSKGYSASSPFSYPHDVVHLINGCVKVLEGGTFEGLTPRQALRFLVHLVGDIHQPLHCVTGYYDLSDLAHPKLQTKFSLIDTDTGDGGGNALDYGPDELHACFDKVLVNDIYATNDPAVLAGHIMQGVTPSVYKTTGALSKWAAKWAGDSMKQATTVYADLEFGPAKLNSHGDLKSMSVTLKPTVALFRAKYAAIMAEQLRKGGVHLADLLNSVDWENEP